MPDVASRAFLAAVVEASRSWGLDGGGLAASQPALGGGAAPWSQPRALGGWASQPLGAPLAAAGRRGRPLPVLGLVDWNPGGLGILATYRFGSAALGLEAARCATGGLRRLAGCRRSAGPGTCARRAAEHPLPACLPPAGPPRRRAPHRSYAVPSLAWLGVTAEMLADAGVPLDRCHALSQRDRSVLASLRARLVAAGAGAGWLAQADEMAAGGVKADIEALPHDALLAALRRGVLQRAWLV